MICLFDYITIETTQEVTKQSFSRGKKTKVQPFRYKLYKPLNACRILNKYNAKIAYQTKLNKMNYQVDVKN